MFSPDQRITSPGSAGLRDSPIRIIVSAEPRQRLGLGRRLRERMMTRTSSTGPGQRSGITTQISAAMARSARKASPMKAPKPGLLNARKNRTKRSSIGPGTKSGKMIQRAPRMVTAVLSAFGALSGSRSSLMERSGLSVRSEELLLRTWLPAFRLLRLKKDLLLSGTSLVDSIDSADCTGPFIRSVFQQFNSGQHIGTASMQPRSRHRAAVLFPGTGSLSTVMIIRFRFRETSVVTRNLVCSV